MYCKCIKRFRFSLHAVEKFKGWGMQEASSSVNLGHVLYKVLVIRELNCLKFFCESHTNVLLV